ncbi:MAG: putative permease yjgp/yjgq family, partial [Akkermansiaceae bacterium]|nr:putative permease yjgp/yjgq family [Akkermansiaceae bacterium]
VFRTPDEKNPGASPVYVYARQAEPDVDKAKKEFHFHLYDAVVMTTGKDGQPSPVVSDEIVPMVLPYEVNEEKAKKTRTMTNQQIRDYVVSEDFDDLQMKEAIKKEVRLRYLGEIPRRFSNSFACLAFACIGVPLGIGARRRDTSTGLMLSLLIGTAYFAMSGMEGHSMTSMVALAWAPNVVCAVLGIYLFRRARRR